MIVVLDSNAMMADPHLAGVAWKVLAHKAQSDNIRIAISEVTFEEVAAGHSRLIAEKSAALVGWVDKNLGRLKLSHLADEMHSAIQSEARGYRQVLELRLKLVPIDLLPMPEVDHAILVRRAADRVPPCDNRGDGYRDTLIWFTLLDLLRNNPEDGVIFVTADSDFLDGTGELHESLLEELLQQQIPRSRLETVPTVQHAALRVMQQNPSDDHGVDDHGVLVEIRDGVEREALELYVRTILLRPPVTPNLTSRQLALPIMSSEPELAQLSVGVISELRTRASLPNDQSVVEVTIRYDALISYVAPAIESLMEDKLSFSTATMDKEVEVGALVTIDSFGRPVEGELTSVAAPSDDPDHANWANFDVSRANLAATIQNLDSFRHVVRESTKNFRIPRATLEAFSAAIKPQLPRERLNALASAINVNAALSADMFNGASAVAGSSEALKAIADLAMPRMSVADLASVKNAAVSPPAKPVSSQGQIDEGIGERVRDKSGEGGEEAPDPDEGD